MNDKANGLALVDIYEGPLKEREGMFQNDKGEDVNYHTRAHEARLEIGGFAYPFDVRLEQGQKEFEPGRYVLRLDKMVECNKGKLFLKKYPVLQPLQAGK